MTATAFAERADKKERRNVTINIRASAHIRDLIDCAASILGKTRSDFILETASERAKDVLLDQTLFALDDKQYTRFIKALDEPALPNDKLKKLLAKKAPWGT
jgi:uncharacterized protein (DUF1778 family)